MYDEIGPCQTHVDEGVRVLLVQWILLFPSPAVLFLVLLLHCRPRLASNRWVGISPTSHGLDPAARDLDLFFELPRPRGRQGPHSQSQRMNFTPPVKPGLPCMRNGFAQLPILQPANPHPPQPHRQLASHGHGRDRALLAHRLGDSSVPVPARAAPRRAPLPPADRATAHCPAC